MELTCAAIHAVDARAWTTDLPSESRSAWLGLISAADAPMMHPGWTEALAAAGTVRPWRVLTIRDSGRIVGVIPLVRRTPISAETPAALAGSFSPLIVAPQADEALGYGIAEATRRGGMPLLGLGPLADIDRVMALCAGVRAGGGYALLREVTPTHAISLPGRWDDYLASLPHAEADQLCHAERTRTPQPHGDPDALAPDAFLTLSEHHTVRAALAWALAQGLGTMCVLGDPAAPTAAAVLHTPGSREAHAVMAVHDPDAPDAPSHRLALKAGIIRWCIDHGVRTLAFAAGEPDAPCFAATVTRPRWEVWVAAARRLASLLTHCDAAFRHLRRWSEAMPWTP